MTYLFDPLFGVSLLQVEAEDVHRSTPSEPGTRSDLVAELICVAIVLAGAIVGILMQWT